MWMSRNVWDEERQARVLAEARLFDNKAYNIQLAAMNDWLKLRLTQLEHERAQLIHNYMGVKISVPTIEPEPVKLSDVLGETVSFDDMGDTEAQKHGVEWNELGEVVYGKK